MERGADSIRPSLASYKMDWNKIDWNFAAKSLLTIINGVILIRIVVFRILQDGEPVPHSLKIDLAAHSLAVITQASSNRLIKGANVVTNALRALEFIYGIAETPLITAFGLFAVLVHGANLWAESLTWDWMARFKRFIHLQGA